MKKKTIIKHGGKRPGAGRPKSGKPTTTLSWRVPTSIAPALKVKIDALIKKEVSKTIRLDSDQ